MISTADLGRTISIPQKKITHFGIKQESYGNIHFALFCSY